MDSGNTVRREAEGPMHGAPIQSALDIIQGGGWMSVTENGPGGQVVDCFKVDKADSLTYMIEIYRSAQSGPYSKMGLRSLFARTASPSNPMGTAFCRQVRDSVYTRERNA